MMTKRRIKGGETQADLERVKKRTDELLRERIAMGAARPRKAKKGGMRVGGEVIDLPYSGGAYTAWNALLTVKHPSLKKAYEKKKKRYERLAAAHRLTIKKEKEMKLAKTPKPKGVMLKKKKPTKVGIQIPKPKMPQPSVAEHIIKQAQRELELERKKQPRESTVYPPEEEELLSSLLGPLRTPGPKQQQQKKKTKPQKKKRSKAPIPFRPAWEKPKPTLESRGLGRRAKNPWLDFVKKFRKMHDPNHQMAYKDILKMAAEDYKATSRPKAGMKAGVRAAARPKMMRVKAGVCAGAQSHKMAAKHNPWLMFVRNFRKQRDPYHEIPYKDILRMAAVEYR